MKASEYFSRILNKTGADRELEALAAFKAGEVPDGLLKKSWPVLTLHETIDGVPHVLEILVAPNFLAVGEDGSAFQLPMWPTTAQKIADTLYSILPSKKLANAIFKASEVRVSLDGVQPDAPWYDYVKKRPVDGGASGAWDSSNKKRQSKGALRYDVLVDGDAKSLLISPKATGSQVFIYGGMNPAGGFPIQGVSDIHPWHYVDYSHAVRLVSRRARLNGKDVDLRSIFLDPKLSILVSDEGPFDPFFPINSTNVGTGAPPIPKSVPVKDSLNPTPHAPAPGAPSKPKSTPASQGEVVSLAAPIAIAAGLAIFFLAR